MFQHYTIITVPLRRHFSEEYVLLGEVRQEWFISESLVSRKIFRISEGGHSDRIKKLDCIGLICRAHHHSR